ncbi:MAG: hypothetical protein ACRC33_11500 [Gemmataceae bacterium]
MRTALLCWVFVAAAYAAVPATDAYVQSRDVSPDGKTITAVVKVNKKGKYVVVAGYAIDKDAKFQYYRGGKSKVKSYDEKELKGEAGDAVEIVFTVKPPPPVVKAKPRITVFGPDEKVPTSD